MHSLHHNLQRYSQHCFMAQNSLPKLENLTNVCFLECQYTNTKFTYTRNPVLEHQVTVLEAWLASTLAHITIPASQDSGIFGGSFSFPCRCPNLLVVHLHLSNAESSISENVKSKTNSAFWLYFRYPKICSSCSRSPSYGIARFEERIKHSKQYPLYPMQPSNEECLLGAGSKMHMTMSALVSYPTWHGTWSASE